MANSRLDEKRGGRPGAAPEDETLPYRVYNASFGDENWFLVAQRARKMVDTRGVVAIIQQLASKTGRSLHHLGIFGSLEQGELKRILFGTSEFTHSQKLGEDWFFELPAVQRVVNAFLDKLLKVHQGYEVEQLFSKPGEDLTEFYDDDADDDSAYRRANPSSAGRIGEKRKQIVQELRAHLVAVIQDLEGIIDGVREVENMRASDARRNNVPLRTNLNKIR